MRNSLAAPSKRRYRNLSLHDKTNTARPAVRPDEPLNTQTEGPFDMSKINSITFAAIIAATTLLAGCNQKWGAVFRAPNGGPVNPAVLQVAKARCNEQYRHSYANADILYGPYKDHTGLIDRAKACMLRQGVLVVGFRQPDGRIEAYPDMPKWMTY